MAALCIYPFFNLGQYVREVIVNLYMRGIQVTPQDAVRAGEHAALYKIDRFVAAADVIPGSGAVPDETPSSFCAYPW